MTERLYYTDPNLLEFQAQLVDTRRVGSRQALVLDRSAFYPTSGGQLYDTGWLGRDGDDLRLRISEVAEAEDGQVLHFIDAPELNADSATSVGLMKNSLLHFQIDAERRRDHMQQHSGQHLLSSVFIDLFQAPTVSFHMGDESCSIDLDTKSLSDDQLRRAERRCNEIVLKDVPVEIRFATADEARQLGVRKIPSHVEGKLRLIEIKGYDLNACGGTHVSRSGEIGAILLRKSEKVKQGVRVEFVCGLRAIAFARRDFDTLTATAALLSAHIHDLPGQVRKLIDEAKTAGKREFKLQEELAELLAVQLLSQAEDRGGVRVVRRYFQDRDLNFIKLLAQRIARQPNAVALLACTQPQPSLVFSQSAGAPHDMGALMKQAMTALGGRGGGTRDMAQGGAPAGSELDTTLAGAEKFIG